jgi:outer membrane protein assembly factor BamB
MSNPHGRSQSINFLAFLSAACLLLCGVASAAPSITLSKKTGPPTSRILVSGRGFAPNVGVDIFFDTKDEALVVTNGQGEFEKARIHAPRSARPGEHWVTALERNDDKGAQESFLVQTDWSEFHFDPEGTGHNPFENVLSPNTVGNLDLKWSYVTGAYVSSSSAVANGVVYAASQDGNLYALNAETGALQWKYVLGPLSGNSSPAVEKGVVHVGGNGTVYALDARTGAQLWAFTANDWVSTPSVSNGVVLVGSGEGTVYALDASTGAELWTFQCAYGYDGAEVYSAPAVANGVVYFGSWDYNVYALDAKTGAKLWSYATGYLVGSSPTVSNGVVYVGSNDGHVYALNASTGGWLWSFDAGYPIISSPAVANRTVYVGSYDFYDSTIYALNASTGAVLWSYPVGYYVYSSPAVANGVVYVGSDNGNVYALDASKGTELWTYTTRLAVESSPAVVNGRVYVGSDDYVMYAFGLPDEQNEAAKRPDLKTLRPDFSLKAPKTSSSPEL